MKCPMCGNECNEKDNVCSNCGFVFKKMSESNNQNFTGNNQNYSYGSENNTEKPFNVNRINNDIPKKKDKTFRILFIIIGCLAVLAMVLTIAVFTVFTNNESDDADLGTLINDSAENEDSSDSNSSTDDSIVDDSSNADSSSNNDEIVDTDINSNLSVSASSTRKNQPGYNYSVQNLVDGDNSTCWVEGVQGNGVGERITFTSDKKLKISGIDIVNGYDYGSDRYYNNGRVENLDVYVDGKYVDMISLDDAFDEMQSFKFDQPIYGKKIELVIKSVYGGDRFKDTCISEVRFF